MTSNIQQEPKQDKQEQQEEQETELDELEIEKIKSSILRKQLRNAKIRPMV